MDWLRRPSWCLGTAGPLVTVLILVREVNKSFSQKSLLTLSKSWEKRCNLYSLQNKDLGCFFFLGGLAGFLYFALFFLLNFQITRKRKKVWEGQEIQSQACSDQHWLSSAVCETSADPPGQHAELCCQYFRTLTQNSSRRPSYSQLSCIAPVHSAFSWQGSTAHI